MEITRDRRVGKLMLSQQSYIEKVFKRYNVTGAKPESIPLASHFKLSPDMLPKKEEEME